MDAPPVQYVTTSDGYNIAYAVCGQGTPLVRVPSTFSHFSLQWNRGVLRAEFEALSRDFRLVMLDCRGQGASTHGLQETTSLDHYVQDLELLVDRLGLKRFVLLGHSAMSKVAVSFALQHPDRVISLVLNQYIDNFRGTRLGAAAIAQSDWGLWLETAARVGWVWADPGTVVHILRESATQEDWLRMYSALQAQPGDDLLRSLQVPTLIMGTLEASRPMGSEAEAKRIAALIPDARLVLFDDVYGGFKSSNEGTPPAIAAIQQVVLELPAAGPVAEAETAAGLSTREVEVLRLLAQGKSNQQIADELVISVNTVIRHVANIFDKTGAANRAQATAYAKDNGIA
jgi:pimeloyl-ACP methyl ester carboxylesterase/DNA-binding CsgD family transcriptional regulator